MGKEKISCLSGHIFSTFLLVLLALASPFLLFSGWWTLPALSLIVISWLTRRWVRGFWSFPTYMDGPVLVLLFMLGVSLLISVDLPLSLNRASVTLLGLVLFYGLANELQSEDQVLGVGFSLLLLALAVALISLLGTDWQLGSLLKSPRLSSFYNALPTLIRGVPGSGVPQQSELFNPRMVAGTSAFLLPLPLSFLLWGPAFKWRVISAFALCILSFTLLLTQSPQGLLALSLAFFVLTLLRGSRWWWLWPLALLLFLLAWKVYFSMALPPALVNRLWIGISSRLEIWQRAIYMIRDMPFTGIALNTFPTLDERFYGLTLVVTPHAHNTFLQMAVDFGIPGLIAFLAMLWGFATTLVRAYKVTSNPNIRTLLLGIAGSVAAWLGYGLADALVLGHKAAMAIWVMFGLVAAVARINGVPARRGSYPKAVWVLLGLTVLSMMPVLGSALALNISYFLMHRAHEQPPPELAIELAQQAVRWYEGNSRAYYLLGLAANQREESEQAVKNWQMTVKLDPCDYLAHYRLGWAYYEQGDLEKAMEQWRISQAAKQVLREAKSQYDAKAWETAKVLYQAAVQLDPEEAAAWYGLGATFIRQQQWNEAIETFRFSIEKFPQGVTAYAQLSALLYERQDKPQEAIAIAELGLKKVEPPKSKVWLYERLARIYWGEGDIERAYQMATQSVVGDANCAGCWEIVGHIHLHQKRYQEALQAYQRTSQTSSSYWLWASHTRIAKVYVARGELAQAVQEQLQAVTLAEALGASEIDISRLYTSLAELLVQAGRFSEAREAYVHALQLEPTNQQAQEQLQDLIN